MPLDSMPAWYVDTTLTACAPVLLLTPDSACGPPACLPAPVVAAAELEQLVPAGSFAGALRTAVLQGRRQMVYHMIQHEAVQTMEPGIMAGILGTAIYHRR